MPARIECPICETELPATITVCPVCGAGLQRVAPAAATSPAADAAPRRSAPQYDSTLGEDDLFAPNVLRFPLWGLIVPVILFGVIMLAVGLWAGSALFAPAVTPTAAMMATPIPTLAMGGQGAPAEPTRTPSPTLFLPTNTPLPPPTNTPTLTPTPAPCEQVVGANDTLTSLAIRCGHQHMDVIDLIVELNGLRSADSLQLNQVILIPWPTPTPGALPTSEPDSAGAEAGAESGLPDESLTAVAGVDGGVIIDADGMVMPIPTATLQPGVMWYRVISGDTILSIAYQFNANVDILSQLNPEVTFSQCDFGMDSGGPNCIVQLFEGQSLRVPAPTPTPTLSRTPSGSETPTPTATPTFNAPSLVSPGDRMLFGADDLVTLRWVSTGVLGEGEVYLVTVQDETTGNTQTMTTTDTLYILPPDMQPTDGERHTYTWYVAVGAADGMGGLASTTFQTESRIFYWESR